MQAIKALKAKPGVDAAFSKGTALHTIASRLRTIHEEKVNKVGQLCAEKERLDFERRLAINCGLVQRGRHTPSCGSRSSRSRSSTKSRSLSSSKGEESDTPSEGVVRGGNLFAELVQSGGILSTGMLGVSSHQQSSADANDANRTAACAPASLGAKREQQVALQRFGARMDCRDAAAASRRSAKQRLQ